MNNVDNYIIMYYYCAWLYLRKHTFSNWLWYNHNLFFIIVWYNIGVQMNLLSPDPVKVNDNTRSIALILDSCYKYL